MTSTPRQLWVVFCHALGECLRRRLFHIAIVLAVGYVTVYWLGVHEAFAHAHGEGFGSGPPGGGSGDPRQVDPVIVAASTMLGLSMFGLQFLGAVLAAFLTLGAVRGEAERGLLQQLAVRPIARSTLLYGRLAGASAVGCSYVLALYVACVLVTHGVTGWWPDNPVIAGLQLAASPIVVGALSVLGSCWFSATSNGVAQFMLLGTGLVGGLLGEIGEGLQSPRLQAIGSDIALALPFEAMYQNALHDITADTRGFTRLAINLGPFGGAHEYGAGLYAWVVAYVVGAIALATWSFRRRDL